MLQLQMVVGGIYKTLLLQVVQVNSYSQSCLRNFLLLNSICQARKIPGGETSPNLSFCLHEFRKDHMTEYVRCDHFVWFAPFSKIATPMIIGMLNRREDQWWWRDGGRAMQHIGCLAYWKRSKWQHWSHSKSPKSNSAYWSLGKGFKRKNVKSTMTFAF